MKVGYTEICDKCLGNIPNASTYALFVNLCMSYVMPEVFSTRYVNGEYCCDEEVKLCIKWLEENGYIVSFEGQEDEIYFQPRGMKDVANANVHTLFCPCNHSIGYAFNAKEGE